MSLSRLFFTNSDNETNNMTKIKDDAYVDERVDAAPDIFRRGGA